MWDSMFQAHETHSMRSQEPYSPHQQRRHKKTANPNENGAAWSAMRARPKTKTEREAEYPRIWRHKSVTRDQIPPLSRGTLYEENMAHRRSKHPVEVREPQWSQPDPSTQQRSQALPTCKNNTYFSESKYEELMHKQIKSQWPRCLLLRDIQHLSTKRDFSNRRPCKTSHRTILFTNILYSLHLQIRTICLA